MKSLRISSAAAIKTTAVFEVIDSSLDGASDLVCLLPLISITDRTGIHTEITLRIDVDHASGFGRSTGILAVTGTMVFAILTFVPGHFRTNELERRDAAAQMRSVAFRLHGKTGIVWTAWDTSLIDGVICLLRIRPGVERNECF